MKNIELKAKAKDLDYEAILKDLGADSIGQDNQEDIYFHTRAGRLKLRRSSLKEDLLIWYEREDVAAEKTSLYHLMPVSHADELESMLQRANDVLVRVKKARQLHILEYVRIHLDDVEGLGRFIELEAVVSENHPEEACRARVRDLMKRFQIEKDDLLPASYSDMLLAGRALNASASGAKKDEAAAGSEIEVFVDGACIMNPGPGGYAFIIKKDGETFSRSGGAAHTTNNRMEMTALIEALGSIPSPGRIKVFTDSQYLKNGMTRWIFTWQKNNWRNANKTPVKNKDLWIRLLDLTRPHTMRWEWIRGHSGHPENERCDRMAVREARKIEEKKE